MSEYLSVLQSRLHFSTCLLLSSSPDELYRVGYYSGVQSLIETMYNSSGGGGGGFGEWGKQNEGEIFSLFF